MVIDGDGDEGDWEDEDGMDVDGQERQHMSKKVKMNEGGAVVAKRMPRSDRRFAGLRDEAVRFYPLFPFFSLDGTV